ncbi:MAG: ASCH domain-containing protein [Oscillospiraceae bacterium]|nr:ASCH domain-containing protein [Oscillospiraceae bacterium]
MTAEQMWAAFAAAKRLEEADYDAWAFGDDAGTLARLVLEGVKTATSSAFPLYGLEGEPLPEAGEYSVILDGREEAVCVIRTERVSVVPFRDVSAEHAYREGEGDRSLAYWREVHQRFFTEELAQAGLAFREDMPVVCEEFCRVWPE